MAEAGSTNAAFVFIKPHANNDKVKAVVQQKLEEAGIEIIREGSYTAQQIDENLYIDTHYGAIANRAVRQQPADLNVPESAQNKFEQAFGLSWSAALEQGLVLNATAAAERLGTDGAGLELEWRKLTKDVDLIKFGGGFYCGKLHDDAGDFYAINGFYLSMRSVYCTPPASITWFSVQWPSANLTWADFRGNVLGATDPTAAPEGSARRHILDNWQSLDLESCPDTGNNGVHASASPIEGLFERLNWLGQDPATDVYGQELIGAGIPVETIREWSSDPAVTWEGAKASLFDLHEDLNAPECTQRALAVQAAQQ
jgi:hypothetical protein